VLPRKADVLLGKGKLIQEHSGNIRCRHVIESFNPRYKISTKMEKTSLARKVVQDMKNSGGRFLKQDAGGWVEVNDEIAREKVSRSFRNHRIVLQKSGWNKETNSIVKPTSSPPPDPGGSTADAKRPRLAQSMYTK
jgi:hypothetical protein